MTLSAKKSLLRVLWEQRDLYSIYWWPLVLVTVLNLKKLEKLTFTFVHYFSSNCVNYKPCVIIISSCRRRRNRKSTASTFTTGRTPVHGRLRTSVAPPQLVLGRSIWCSAGCYPTPRTVSGWPHTTGMAPATTATRPCRKRSVCEHCSGPIINYEQWRTGPRCQPPLGPPLSLVIE